MNHTCTLANSVLVGLCVLAVIVQLVRAVAAMVGVPVVWMRPQGAPADGYYLGLPVWCWNCAYLALQAGLLFLLWNERKRRREAPDEGRFLGNDFGPSYGPVQSEAQREEG